MPVLLAVLREWKAVLVCSAIVAIAGYLYLLRANVQTLEKENEESKRNIVILEVDLEAAKAGIDNVVEGVRRYRKNVDASLAAQAEVQKQISNQNLQLQAKLDNLVVLATTARRIVDAPRIPFFIDAMAPVPPGADNSSIGRDRLHAP